MFLWLVMVRWLVVYSCVVRAFWSRYVVGPRCVSVDHLFVLLHYLSTSLVYGMYVFSLHIIHSSMCFPYVLFTLECVFITLQPLHAFSFIAHVLTVEGHIAMAHFCLSVCFHDVR